MSGMAIETSSSISRICGSHKHNLLSLVHSRALVFCYILWVLICVAALCDKTYAVAVSTLLCLPLVPSTGSGCTFALLLAIAAAFRFSLAEQKRNAANDQIRALRKSCI